MLQIYHIELIFVQYMKHRMQIMQECSGYDLMTNCVNCEVNTTNKSSIVRSVY